MIRNRESGQSQAPLVYVASPYAGDTDLNTKNAVRYCRFAAESNAVPFAPHLFLPLFVSEETERGLAMQMNKVFLGRCDQLWVFGNKITDGMAAEITWARQMGMPIRFFDEKCVESAGRDS